MAIADNKVRDDFVKWLEASGWMRDVWRDGWISANGSFVPSSQIAASSHSELANLYAALSANPNLTVSRPQSPPSQWSPYEKLAMRLNLAKDDNFGLDHIHINIGANNVHVFIVHNDQSVIFEDDKNLFPSDTLVAKFRLFIEATK